MKVNYKLLKRLYLIDHTSTEEHDMISFILNYCYKIPHLSFKLDSSNNLFITKNTTNPDYYVCLIAHMDTIQTFSRPREIVRQQNMIWAQYIDDHAPCGLNADDCNGILVCLQLLEVLPNIKVCFTVEEELGACGAKTAAKSKEFFEDVQCLIQADRRGDSDLIIHTNGCRIAPEDFLTDIKAITEMYGYSNEIGTFTDVGVLAKELCIAGINVSCGYYNEHTQAECCALNELENALNFIHTIITTLPAKMYFIDPVISTPSYKDYNFEDDYIYPYPEKDPPCSTCKDFDCMNCPHIQN